MAATYDLGADFNTGDELSTQVPYWVIGIARYANQATWDPRTRRSISTSDDVALAEFRPLVLTSEVQQVQTSASKEAHVTNLSATLQPHTNFLSEVMTGDWVVCCMLNSEQKGREVAERMRQGQPINRWGDGLKFLGKVSSCRQRLHVDRKAGSVRTQYQLQAAGFREFESKLFYNPQLQKSFPTGSALEEFGILIQKVTNGSDGSVQKGTVDINKILPTLVEVIFGKGPWARARGTTISGQNVPASPNSRYLVPATIASWLGMPGARTYNQILNVLLGVQHYRTVQHATEQTTKTPWTLFRPETSDLIGWLPLSPPPTQGSVWDMLSAFMNPPLNEMYVALRAHPETGQVLPHFIVRQTPYNSPMVQEALEEHLRSAQQDIGRPLDQQDPARADATDFLELPRWRLPMSLLYDGDIGRADAGRVNMVHVSGTGYGALVDEVGSFVRAPPVLDELDVRRNGLLPYLTGVNCVLRDLAKGPTVWRDLMADVVMGQHLKFSGNLVSVGIEAPIAQGDNLEFDGLVFHIENVAHIAGIQPDGTRAFQTILQVSHGIEGEDRQAQNRAAGSGERTATFGGVGDQVEQDLAGFQQNVTVDEEAD